jgi:hypothetical protein
MRERGRESEGWGARREKRGGRKTKWTKDRIFAKL